MTYYRLFYHIVWTTKQRLPLITAANEAAIYRSIRHKVDELKGIVHAANGMDDHVHLVLTIPPSVELAECVAQLKGVSSYIASKQDSAPFAWQREYGILSVSESHLPTVVRYVDLQKQHHAENKLDSRLEMTHVKT